MVETMKLQILVPHYHETAEEMRPLLDSIALQQNVDFDEIGVIICHDGEEIPDLDIAEAWDTADVSALPPYPFEIRQIRQEHKGVSAARNACLDAATAEYVMFCDADDMFYNACGMWILFREMATGFDSLVCFGKWRRVLTVWCRFSSRKPGCRIRRKSPTLTVKWIPPLYTGRSIGGSI